MADEAPTDLPVRRPGATLPEQERARRLFISPPGLPPIVLQPQEGPQRTVRNQITAQVLYVVSVLALGGSITLAVSRGW